jgi:hypothetical protein
MRMTTSTFTSRVALAGKRLSDNVVWTAHAGINVAPIVPAPPGAALVWGELGTRRRVYFAQTGAQGGAPK